MNVRRKVGPLPTWRQALAGVTDWFLDWFVDRPAWREFPDDRPGGGAAVGPPATDRRAFRRPGGSGVGSPDSLPASTDPLTRGGHRGIAATAAASVLAVLGTTAIGVAAFSQQHAPQPPASAAGSIGAIPAARASPQPAVKVVGPVLPPSKPLALDIPAIGVQSPLLHLGQTAQGTVEVPPPGQHYDDAAWYRYSPTPGSLGPAVIVGHVDSTAGGPSVFFNLGDLRPGDTVRVSREDGPAAVFTVDGVRRFPKDRFPTQLVYGNTNHAALRLVTCAGPFDVATGEYPDNIIVFASLAASDEPSRAAGYS